ncbi:FtsX-like permease family protein [Mucilaginibacter robiniae]|uniref:FtsX-like permease family protein n=1 Tax=Mucilaginibacter robiniae TaxID=2728022 RepID=A0A7L5DZK3_9SPHI|nr:FtsX-like permease family protein [Mucilaginibacter robiniae]QJD95459.1 FtsX-like permease family protein [Mucilaginibacter robiniae]
MNLLKLSYLDLKATALTTLLNLLLIAFGIGILTILMLSDRQLNDQLEANTKNIDLVVGAKGSPLQLVLSSIFYVDFPTGNIPLKDAQQLMHNPMVKLAVPLALGDNYNGYRIAGTNTSFIQLYNLTLQSGCYWKRDFEVTVGCNVAREEHLHLGSHFFGAHGLTSQSDVHKAHAYVVTGILRPQHNVTDNLVLTSVASVWRMHEHEDEHLITQSEMHDRSGNSKEITSILIQYWSPMSVAMFPRMVNQVTNLQAASPAMESARLFSLIGIGIKTLQNLAYLIMLISGISVFISLYNSLKEQRYELAILRSIGALPSTLFSLMVLKALLLTFCGSLFGLIAGHVILIWIGFHQQADQPTLDSTSFIYNEVYLVLAALGVGFLAVLIPAIQAYRTPISQTLAQLQ